MELVMPDGTVASADLEPLRKAYARRLLRTLAERHPGSEVVKRLGAFARAEPDRARELLLDPTLAVAIEVGADRDALTGLAFALARVRALGPTRRELAPILSGWSLAANLRVHARRSLALADGAVFVDDEPVPLDDDSRGPDDPGRLERPFPVLAGDIRFALFDPNPLALYETHPDKDGNALSLGDVPREQWLASLRTAVGLVETHLPSIAAEMHAMLRLVIPVGASTTRHLSASFREYVGAVYVSLHPDPVTMAEALVHEFQHNKLNLLSWHYPLLENGYDELYQSPVRPDPRPLMGILLAAHAFVPVAELHRRLLEAAPPSLDLAGVRRRLSDVVARNEEALSVVTLRGRAAPAGTFVLERLRELHARHRAMALELPTDVSHVA